MSTRTSLEPTIAESSLETSTLRTDRRTTRRAQARSNPRVSHPHQLAGTHPIRGWSQEPASHRRQVARESLTEVNSSSVCVTTFLSAVALAECAAALGVAMEPDDDDEDYESDETWESDLDSEAEIAEIMQLDIAEDTANTGKKEYLAK